MSHPVPAPVTRPSKLPSSLMTIVITLGLILLGSCSDGGSNRITTSTASPDSAPPPPIEGSISGRVIVPPNHVLELEPNNMPNQAQAIDQADRVSGQASATDSGYLVQEVSGAVTDLYSLSTDRPVRVTLTIGANELYNFDPESDTIIEVVNDLDLVLLDSEGNLIAFSEGLTETESIDIPTPGEYLVGIRASVGSSSYVVAVSPLPLFFSDGAGVGSIAAAVTAQEFIVGEVLMKPHQLSSNLSGSRQALAKSHGAEYLRTLSPGIDLLKVPEPTNTVNARAAQASTKIDPTMVQTHLLRAATIEVVRRLQADPDVAWAEPNYVRRALAIPNDPEYARQWHYEQIKLPDAWDTTTGSDNIIVAVLDTGILSEHPDLAGRLIPGYDFLTSLSRSQDGNGIDPNPEDPGDDPKHQNSSFHGTHVAGTIGATTNNSIGVAGVTWQTRIMPVRVLGAGGGTSSEVSQGIRFAAGLENDSGTVPPEPAHVINMSLGGGGTSKIEQEAITAAREAGVIIIAAAGNDSSDDMYSPAGLDGVISVSSTGATGKKASYSNYGEKVDVAAPGGEFWDSDGDDRLDAVLSTLGDDRGDFIYRYYQGTSMASPHMAGVVALMLAVNPTLTPADIDMLLEGTHPDTSNRITIDLGRTGRDDYFGHGLIDAAAAVVAVGGIPGGEGSPIGPEGSRAAVFPSSLDFRNFLTRLPIIVSNAGIDTLNVTSATSDVTWLTLSPASGEAPLSIEAVVNVSDLEDGSYTGTVIIETDATEGEPDLTIEVAVTVGGSTSGDAGSIVVQVVSADGSQIIAEVTTDAAQDYAYSLPSVAPGTYLIRAGTDRDGDSSLCDIEDVCVDQPAEVTVNDSGDDVDDVELLMVFGAGRQTAPIVNDEEEEDDDE